MAKTKISEYSTTNANNSDIQSINIAEGCAPSGINNAIRELMVHLKNFQTGASGDSVTVGGSFVVSGTSNLVGTATIDGLQYPSVDGTSGQVIQTNGAGVLSFATPLSGPGSSTNNNLVAFDGTTGKIIKDSGKAFPSGTIVGTSDTQTLTAKTLTTPRETCTVSATTATGTINFDAITQSVLYYTSNASANWVVNIRGDGSTTLNSLLATGSSITVAFLVPQGTTAYYNTSVQIDGTTSGVTTRWQGSAPTAGNTSGIDIYVYTVIKTASATYTVLASQTKFS